MVDPWQLHWGQITPEFYSDAHKMALHVYCHNLESEENVGKTLRFVKARLRWFEEHLPVGTKQAVRFDDSGMNVSPAVRQAIRDLLGSRVTSVVFESEPRK